MTASTCVVFVGHPPRWALIDDGLIVDRGDGFPNVGEGAGLVVVIPATDVVVHQLALPELTDAQARGAARIAVAENSVSPIATLHVAVSADIDGQRTVVVIDTLLMQDYLAAFVALDLDPDAVIAAPLVLPRPEVGFVTADIGGERLIRGRDGAFADDPVLTPLLTGGQMVTLDQGQADQALIAAVAAPEVDLRQGGFGRRRRWAVDAARLRRIGWLAAACLATLFVIPVVDLLHLNAAARRIELQNVAIALAALPPGTVVVDPLVQLDERLAAVGGAGGGFLPLAGAVVSAASKTADVELGTMNFDSEGGLRVNAHATGMADLAAFEARMVAAGLVVTPTPTVAGMGRPARDFVVRAR
ncbi:type II secretion system protein GspL [Sphingomonas sp.]|uniref:type II secretion system protein GspL n=1 Tax=Sphingomonas sp. TaxID=28214 RepID=UPI0025D872BC|nr:type II secretion system protein GspL [Sphingomonas sp.]